MSMHRPFRMAKAMTKPIDERTREGQEQLVINQVKAHGGFSVFWVTENQKRAHAASRLSERGVLVETRKAVFPWHALKVVDEQNDHQN